MNGQTREKFLSCIERSELVERNRLAQALAEIDAADPQAADDCDRLASALIERKLLTRWQVDNLRQGKSKGFLLGQYTLLGLIGSGHSACVYLAQHRMTSTLRALKVVPVIRAGSPAWMARFINGAALGAAIKHPSVAGHYDMAVHGKHPYIVMEYVEGYDLQTIVTKHGPLEWRLAVDYIRPVAETLAHLHSSGLVHRDVKPSHLMVDNQGLVLLLDFSLARRIEESTTQSLEASYEADWEPHDFLAPEQARDPALVDPRSDIYSLGCTLYFLLTGRPPFAPGRNKVQRILMHQAAVPLDISDFRGDVPTMLANLCLRMMAGSPDDRPQTAAAVIAELAAIV